MPNRSSADQQAIRQVAERFVQAINGRDYQTLPDLFARACRSGVTEEQQRQGWEAVAKRLGDDAFSLEIRTFETERITHDRAEVVAEVVAHASGREIPMGTAADPFFDVFVREDGKWTVADLTCS